MEMMDMTEREPAEMKPHALAVLIPEMAAYERNKLAQDIAQNGPIEPIVTLDGKILDAATATGPAAPPGLRPKRRTSSRPFAGRSPCPKPRPSSATRNPRGPPCWTRSASPAKSRRRPCARSGRRPSGRTSVKAAQLYAALADARAWLSRLLMADLLLTDPPYSTDSPDIAAFAQAWLPAALDRLNSTGRAYVFVGAYPAELSAYPAGARPPRSWSGRR